MDYVGKKVLVLGAARSGVAAAKLLHASGAQVIVNDAASQDKLKWDISALQENNIPLIAGGHPLSLLDEKFDLLIKSPGIPPHIPFLQAVRERGIPIISEIELAYHFNKGHMITLTGSNGKTTSTTWLGDMMQRDRPKVILAGNNDIPLSTETLSSDEDTWLVVELSSFQLNDIRDFHSEAAAIINISPAHLDWHGDFAGYYQAKSNLLLNQKATDTAVLNADNQYTLELAKSAKGRVLLFSRQREVEQGAFLRGETIWVRMNGAEFPLIERREMKLGYVHNVENAMAASLMALAVGVKLEHIRGALREFTGLAHRFQVVAKIADRTFINDSKATNPGASEVALTLPGEPIVLIAGGMERHIELTAFAQQITKYCRSVVLIGETKERLAADLRSFGFTAIHIVDTMAQAVPLAYALSEAGDTILLSTGCASWDMYANYDYRGDDFIALVQKLQE
ncbi:MAG: UDP-N-acetylmuramoyl-L-alanine--D-glutamate ligase [Symbiobacteriaceae bacterium]|nr:UDP-N-acetylmuramoyl-L-alanine--D-glutamate ligase [Symbiobacteriaceae bacterium]